MDGRPNRMKKSCVFKLIRISVDGALVHDMKTSNMFYQKPLWVSGFIQLFTKSNKIRQILINGIK